GSTIGNGELQRLDVVAAEATPGVRAILHRGNLNKLFRAEASFSFDEHASYLDEQRPAFEDDVIRYYGQYVALAVPDTFEQASAAASAVKATYRAAKPNVDHDLLQDKAASEPSVDSRRGDAEKAYNESPVQFDATYVLPTETHNPIELHATVALWDGG